MKTTLIKNFSSLINEKFRKSLLLEKYIALEDNNFLDTSKNYKQTKNKSVEENIKDLYLAMDMSLKFDKIKNIQKNKNALQIAVFLAKLLKENNISYSLGGTLCFGVLVCPRVTYEVEMNIKK